MVKILLADPFPRSIRSGLRQLAADVVYAPDLGAAGLGAALSDVGILVVHSTRVDERTLAAAPELGLIIRAGTAVNTLDINAATDRGIYVAYCPGRDAAAEAELVIGLLIAMDRRLLEAATDMRGGLWRRDAYGPGMGLAGRCMGILGLGATGQALAKAARGLGMEVAGWSPGLTPGQAARLGVRFCARPADVARCADVVSIHLAANASTYHLVNNRVLKHLRQGAYLINTSHADIVAPAALKEAIRARGLRVALDVLAAEPGQDGRQALDDELLQMVLATPHIGALTQEAQEATAQEVIAIAREFIAGGVPPHAVNAPRATGPVFDQATREAFSLVAV